MKRLKPIIVIAASIAVVVVAHHFLKRSQPQQRRTGGGETAVVTEVVGLRRFAHRTEAIGTVSANESVTITPAASERIAAVHVEDGALVKPGDVLVELEHAEESAALEEARIDLAQQTRQFDRVEALRERDLVSQEDLDLARGNLDAANARVLAAQARLGDRIITAPFAGVLGIRRVSPGALVGPGDVITTLDDLSVVKVDFTIPEALLADVGIGQHVEARCAPWPDDVFEGRVTAIDSRVDPTTRAASVQARIPNPERRLRAGMLLTVIMTCHPREALGVPERTLVSYADKQYVFLVRGDQTVEQREVRLGERDVGWVEVEEGINMGDTIVVDGLLSLRDGASVRVESSDAALDQGAASVSPTERRPE